MQPELSTESTEINILGTNLSGSLWPQHRGAKFLQLSFCCCSDHLKQVVEAASPSALLKSSHLAETLYKLCWIEKQ